MADIGQISDNEQGSSVRGKLNLSIDESNKVLNGTITRTGNTLVFDSIFGALYNAETPSSAATITLSQTNAVVGSVCAFYNDGSAEPTITPIPNPQAGTWVSGEVNVYWFMWDGYNFTQNIQAKAAVVLPTLTDPTYTLSAGSALELDYTFDTVDTNATGGVFEISTDATFATGTESVTGYSFGVDGTIDEYNSLPLIGGTTYYTRLQSTASGYNSSGFSEENATAVATPTLTTPTIVITTGDTQNSIYRTVEDANATGGVLEWSLDGVSGWSAVPGFVFGTTPTVHSSLTNYVEYFYRYKSTAAGYNDSALATGSITTAVIFEDKFTGTVIDSTKWNTPVDSAYFGVTQNNGLLFTGLQTQPATAAGAEITSNTKFNFDSTGKEFCYLFSVDMGGTSIVSTRQQQLRTPDNTNAFIPNKNSVDNSLLDMLIKESSSVVSTENTGLVYDGSFKLHCNGSGTYNLYKWDGVSSWGSSIATETYYDHTDYEFRLQVANDSILGAVYTVNHIILVLGDITTETP